MAYAMLKNARVVEELHKKSTSRTQNMRNRLDARLEIAVLQIGQHVSERQSSTELLLHEFWKGEHVALDVVRPTLTERTLVLMRLVNLRRGLVDAHSTITF